MDDTSITVAKMVTQNLSAIAQAVKNAFPMSGTIGTFTMQAGVPSTTISAPQVVATSHIALTPTSASAALAMVYVSARTAGTGFTVSTGAGGNAAGTESFTYQITKMS